MKLVSTTQPAALTFASAPTYLGTVLVAQSGAKVAAVLLGADADAVLGELAGRFAHARLEAGAAGLDAVLAAIDDPARGFSGDLAMGGTDFQRRVWTALRDIPVGETRSYAQIAQALGAPAAVRAVAAACAANSIAVLIPCHRVVRADGSLSGYRWGVERKRALLDRERRVALALAA